MPRRVFLGLDQPALISAVAYLRKTYLQDRVWDLSNVVLVVPGGRVGRRLLELLVLEASDHKLELLPPAITTEGGLPEQLYPLKWLIADPLTQEMAWSSALRKLPAKQLAAIVPHPPAREDESAWRTLAKILKTYHTELAADNLDFADVARLGKNLPGFPDEERWLAMSVVQRTYFDTLDGLKLWDAQTARRIAISKTEITTTRDIVLLGTVDLTRTMRLILDEISPRVTALIAAPESWAIRFDSHGCVVPLAWLEAMIELPDSHITRVDGPAEQADAVATILAGYEGKYRGDQITIGVPDERLVPHIQRQLEQLEVPVRWVVGKLLAESSPYRLLAALAEFLEDSSMAAFASVVRHPDVYSWMLAGGVGSAILAELDWLVSEYMAARCDPALWSPAAKRKVEEGEFKHLVAAIALLEALLQSLRAKAQPLAKWSPPILNVLREVYGPRLGEVTREAITNLATIEAIREVLEKYATLPDSLSPPLTASEAIRWTLSQIQGEAIPPPADANAVELLGWLELPLDDAPALIVTTFNEGFVPSSLLSDQFLPNNLRRQLGLLDNDRRYARDAYSVSALAASRESLHVIAARRDTESNPLAPSRLLFADATPVIVQRGLHFFAPLRETLRRAPLIGAGLPLPSRSQLEVPLPGLGGETLQEMRVTQFRDYLACPYRYYLKQVLRLESPGDEPEELAANTFGNLVHWVLQAFGRDENVRDLAQEEKISAYLEDRLQIYARQQFGEKNRLAAVELQIEQIRARLRRFAAWQARRVADGWRIVHTETADDEEAKKEQPVPFDVDGSPISLIGRIDRIDRHASTGQLVVFDYKTGDSGDSPKQTHLRGGEWVDLQLPLYRHLARGWGLEGAIDLGYILLPKSLETIGEALADWTDADLEAADETAREVVRALRRREFWPPGDAPKYDDAFTAICQDHRLGGPMHAEPRKESRSR